MYYIITGDFENISFEFIRDPAEVEKRYGWLWSHAEFEALTGIVLPSDLYSLSIEPDRDIYAFKIEGAEEAESYQAIGDAPQWIQDIVARSGEMRKHAKAAIKETLVENRGQHFFTYDPVTDTTTKTDHPDKDHNRGKRFIFSNRFADRMLPVLIDILLAKGVIVDADLPAAYHNKIPKIKKALADIDWSR